MRNVTMNNDHASCKGENSHTYPVADERYQVQKLDSTASRATVQDLRLDHPVIGVLRSVPWFLGTSLKKALLSPWTVVFSIGMPVLLYLIFAVGKSYSDISVGNANAAGLIMVNLALYGTAISSSMFGARIALERSRGWLKTMDLTPMGSKTYAVVHTIVSTCIVAIVLVIIGIVGSFTGVHMTAEAWSESFILAVLCSLVTTLLGLATGLLIRADEVFGVLGGGMAILGFLSGLFIPLDQIGSFFKAFAKFTPLWGIDQIVIYPLLGWSHFEWGVLANIAVWLIICAAATLLLLKRPNRR